MPTLPTTPPLTCSSNPLIRLGDDYANAPVLNYNMEQENCINIKTRVPLSIPQDYFLSSETSPPDTALDTFWAAIPAMDISTITQNLIADLHTSHSMFFLNYDLLNKSVHPAVFYQKIQPTYFHEDSLQLNPLFPSFLKYPLYISNGKENVMAVVIKGNRINHVATYSEVEFPLTESPVGTNPFLSRRKPTTINFPNGVAAEFDIDVIAAKFKAGYRARIVKRHGGFVDIEFYKEAAEVHHPQLFLEYDLMLCSYLGNYGAGKTVGTFSLLPGEKTTISMSTYLDNSSTSSRSQNILDSKSEASANSFESALQQQSGQQTDGSFSSSMSDDGSATFSIPLIFSAGGGGGSSSSSEMHISTIASTISNTVSNSVNQSNHNREVNINSSSSQTTNSGEQTSIVRELENINLSRTLNFVFRQLLQEHIALLWLRNIRFGYTNGSPASTKIVLSQSLKDLLGSVLRPEFVTTIYQQIMQQVSYIIDYNEDQVRFFECRHFSTAPTDCCDGTHTDPKDNCLWLRVKGLSDTYDRFTVPGIIISAERHVLKTPSVIVDALLGQGEALDCYNMNTQQQAVITQQLNNQKLSQAIDIIDGFTNNDDKAKFYKKVFGDCCDVPQSGGGCGCGNCNDNTSSPPNY